MRKYAAIPFEILQILLMGLGAGCSLIGRLFSRAGDVVVRRLYYPVVVAKRVVVGDPKWKPIDQMIGVKAPPEYPRCCHGVPQGIECFWCTSGREPVELVVSEVQDDGPGAL